MLEVKLNGLDRTALIREPTGTIWQLTLSEAQSVPLIQVNADTWEGALGLVSCRTRKIDDCHPFLKVRCALQELIDQTLQHGSR
jgi:hypothetical protein